MKSEIHKEIKEYLEKIKESLPSLERSIKSRTSKRIKYSVERLVWYLHRIHKKATGKPTVASIRDMTNAIWWFKGKKEKEQRKFLNVNDLYKTWSKSYDIDDNWLIYMEEKVSSRFFGSIKGKEVLDFGCGTGRYAIPLSKKGANVTAIDFTSAMLNKAKKKAKKEKVKIDFSKQDITKYKPYKKYDLIISMLVQDHIKDLKKSVNVIDKASKLGTKVVISNVHPELLRKDADMKTGKAQGYLVEGIKTNQYFHTLSEYVKLFLEKGFVLTKVEDLIFTRKHAKMRIFQKLASFEGRSVGIIIKFEKRA